MFTIVLVTILGNVFVLRISTRRSTTRLISSLATADLLLGLTVLPLAAMREVYNFKLGWIWCALWSTMDVMCCTASILSLAVLGWERHSGVVNPLGTTIRAKRTRLLTALIWPISALVAIPTAFIPSPIHHHPLGSENKVCTVNVNVGYVFFSITFSFYLPAVAMLIMYGRVIRTLKSLPPIRAHRGKSPSVKEDEQKSPKTSVLKTPIKIIQDAIRDRLFLSPTGQHLGVPNCNHDPKSPLGYLGDLLSPGRPNRSEDAIRTRQIKAIRTIIFLMSLFLLCWTPFFVMLPVDAICGCVVDQVFTISTWLGYLNSTINPLVYLFTSTSLRRALSSSKGSKSSDMPLSTPRKLFEPGGSG